MLCSIALYSQNILLHPTISPKCQYPPMQHRGYTRCADNGPYVARALQQAQPSLPIGSPPPSMSSHLEHRHCRCKGLVWVSSSFLCRQIQRPCRLLSPVLFMIITNSKGRQVPHRVVAVWWSTYLVNMHPPRARWSFSLTSRPFDLAVLWRPHLTYSCVDWFDFWFIH